MLRMEDAWRTFRPHLHEEAVHSEAFVPKDSDLLWYVLPSHPQSLFSRLQALREEGLLLDCTFDVQGSIFRAHRLLLAASSQTPQMFFPCKQNPQSEAEETSHCLTPLGLRAALKFAYCGQVDLGGEEVLDTCQHLNFERLREKSKSGVTTSAEKETAKTLENIKNMWDRGEGCDITIRAETGESYPGKTRHIRLNLKDNTLKSKLGFF